MSNLYNTKTGKPEKLSEDQLTDAVKSGTHGYKKGTKVDVLDPDGQSYSVDSSELSTVLNEGYSIEAPRQIAVREYVKDNKGLKGTVKVALSQFADEALMGLPEIIYDNTGDPLEVAKKEALKNEHNIANAIGGVAGFGTSLLYGGPVGKVVAGSEAVGKLATNAIAKRLAEGGVKTGVRALAKDLAGKAAVNGARLSIEGAAYAAPQAITEAALGDPELAAETLIVNGLAGAGLGIAGSALKNLTKLGVEAIPDDFISSMQRKAAAKAVGFSKGQINKLKGGQAEAEQIGEELLNMTTEAGEKIIGPTDSVEKIASKISGEKSRYGKEVSEVYKTVDASGQNFFNPIQAIERIEGELGATYRDPLNKDILPLYENFLESIGTSEKGMTLERAKTILDKFDKTAFPKGKVPLAPSEKQTMAYEVRTILRDELNAAADLGAQAIGDTEAYNRLVDGNRKISTLIKAEKAIKDRISSQSGNKMFGLTDVIAGAGIGSVNPIAGAVTVAGKKLAENYGNQILANTRGLLYAEQAMKKTAKALDDIPSALDSMMKGGSRAVKGSSFGAINRLLGNEDAKQSKLEQFNDLSNRIAEFNENPAYSTDRMAQATSGLSQTGAPETANQLSLKTSVIMRYLQDTIPKQLTISTPFKQVKWKPSDFELSQFERRVHAIQQPLSIIDDMKSGVLSPEAVNAVKTVYPKLFERIQERVLNHFMDSPQTVPYQQRIKLSMLLDQPLDSDLQPKNIAQFQKNFLQQSEMEKGASKLNLTTTPTETQRISGK